MKEIINNPKIEIKNVDTCNDLNIVMDGFALYADVYINDEKIGSYECIYTEGVHSGKSYLDTSNAPETDELLTAIDERFENDYDEISGAVYDLVKAAGDEIEVTYDLISICYQMDQAPVTDWLMSKFEDNVLLANDYDLEQLTEFFKKSPEERKEEVLVYAKEMKEKYLDNEEYVNEIHGEDEFYFQKILERTKKLSDPNDSLCDYFSFQEVLRDEQCDIIVEAKNRLTEGLEP